MNYDNMSATKIGSGRFSIAYRIDNTDRVIIFTKTEDNNHANNNTKEIYTHIESPHVPYMETIDTEVYMPRIGHVNIYESRYYNRLTAANTAAWRDYQALRKAWDHIMSQSTMLLHDKHKRHEICQNFIDYLEAHAIVSNELLRALDLIYTWATAYGSTGLFEFSPRNLKVDSNGKLILLDIVFFV